MAATVVAPCTAARGHDGQVAHAALDDVLAARSPRARRRRARSAPRPSTTAIVAGTAPAARTAASSSRATVEVARPRQPVAMSVLSSATTGRPPASASATSGAIRIER